MTWSIEEQRVGLYLPFDTEVKLMVRNMVGSSNFRWIIIFKDWRILYSLNSNLDESVYTLHYQYRH